MDEHTPALEQGAQAPAWEVSSARRARAVMQKTAVAVTVAARTTSRYQLFIPGSFICSCQICFCLSQITERENEQKIWEREGVPLSRVFQCLNLDILSSA